MTHDEIDKRVLLELAGHFTEEGHTYTLGSSLAPLRELIVRLIKEHRAQALEEAAKVADASSYHTYEANVGRVSASIAKDIRALKPSAEALVQPTG